MERRDQHAPGSSSRACCGAGAIGRAVVVGYGPGKEGTIPARSLRIVWIASDFEPFGRDWAQMKDCGAASTPHLTPSPPLLGSSSGRHGRLLVSWAAPRPNGPGPSPWRPRRGDVGETKQTAQCPGLSQATAAIHQHPTPSPLFYSNLMVLVGRVCERWWLLAVVAAALISQDGHRRNVWSSTTTLAQRGRDRRGERASRSCVAAVSIPSHSYTPALV